MLMPVAAHPLHCVDARVRIRSMTQDNARFNGLLGTVANVRSTFAGDLLEVDLDNGDVCLASTDEVCDPRA